VFRFRSGMLWRGGMLPGKGGDFVAVSADGHGTPAAAVRAGIVVEKEAATGIGAEPQPCPGTLGDKFRRGTGHRCQQPIEATLVGDEFDPPDTVVTKQFVVTFGDAQDVVDGLGPFTRNPLFAVHGREDLSKGGTELTGFQEKSFGGLWIGLRQGQELCAAFGRDDFCGLQEVNEFLPGKGLRRRGGVDEVEAKASAEEGRGDGHWGASNNRLTLT
jgi:hypothetical protein